MRGAPLRMQSSPGRAPKDSKKNAQLLTTANRTVKLEGFTHNYGHSGKFHLQVVTCSKKCDSTLLSFLGISAGKHPCSKDTKKILTKPPTETKNKLPKFSQQFRKNRRRILDSFGKERTSSPGWRERDWPPRLSLIKSSNAF